MNEIIEVWCTNDASVAVGVVNGTSYCATCICFAIAEKAKVEQAARTAWDRQQEILGLLDAGTVDTLTDDELVEWEDREHSALLAWPTDGARKAWEALNAEIGRRGLGR